MQMHTLSVAIELSPLSMACLEQGVFGAGSVWLCGGGSGDCSGGVKSCDDGVVSSPGMKTWRMMAQQ